MPNLELVKKESLSSFRRIAIGTWRDAYDPTVYGSLTLRMDEAVRYIDEFRKRTGKRITVTHLMAKATAAALARMPDANAILRFNRPYLRQRIGVFFQVAMEDDDTKEIDLSGATIMDTDKKSLVEIIDEFQAQVEKVRSKKDEALEKTRSTFKSIPFMLLNLALRLISFFSYTLNLDLRKLGIPKDPFGSVMITNIGSLGLDEAYVPLVPYSRVPLLLAVGAVKEAALVENGAVKVGKVMRVHATFDHRLLDGTHAAIMSKVLTAWMEHPYEHFDDLSELKPAAVSETAAA
ncbi:MAG TPA: 2-oxo acid dehydrogenase subunit E2 [Myxococcota bacterium]|jgi:pyruvate dehydrogenase E2 component (dihydrolipoamide acetyltransferase)|nr:2-oxo acid dehydrogenase subunit E2 [Myxococcota bacterium]